MSLPRRKEDNRGFTLLEVMIAMAIASAALVTLLTAVNGAITMSAIAKNQSIAVALAREKMDQLIMIGYQEGGGSYSGDFGEDFLTFTWEAEFKAQEELNAYIEAINAGFTVQEVILNVRWKDGNSEKVFTLGTILNSHQVNTDPPVFEGGP